MSESDTHATNNVNDTTAEPSRCKRCNGPITPSWADKHGTLRSCLNCGGPDHEERIALDDGGQRRDAHSYRQFRRKGHRL